MSKRKERPTVAVPQGEAYSSAAEWLPLSALEPWKLNPRKNDKAVGQVADAIARFGFTAPILARRVAGGPHEICAGHTRFQAAKRLGMTTVPVRLLDVTETEAHAIALADNKLGEVATWDETMLAEVLQDLRAHDAPLAETGFTDAEIDHLIAKAEKVGEDGSLSADPSVDQTTELKGQYLVVIECADEAKQLEVLEKLTGEGYACRALVS